MLTRVTLAAMRRVDGGRQVQKQDIHLEVGDDCGLDQGVVVEKRSGGNPKTTLFGD